MNFLKKIQRQPEHIRKLILWAITIIIGLGLIIFWFWTSYRGMRGFSKERFIQNLNFPSLKAETENFSGEKIPPSLGKELKQIEEKAGKDK